MTTPSLRVGQSLQLTDAGLIGDGATVELYDSADFRVFLTSVQVHICGTLEQVFGDMPVSLLVQPEETKLVRSTNAPWKEFARHSLDYLNGDTSSARYLTAWCIAADIVTRMLRGGGSDGISAFGDGLLAIRYIAGGAWRAAEVPESAAAAYKMAMSAWLALGVEARLEGIPAPQDPRKALSPPLMPWLGPLHPLLGEAPALEDFVKSGSITDFIVLESGEAIITCGRHAMRWHRKLPEAIAAFHTAAEGRNTASVVLADWNVVSFRVQKLMGQSGDRYSFRAQVQHAPSLSVGQIAGINFAMTGSISVEDPPEVSIPYAAQAPCQPGQSHLYIGGIPVDEYEARQKLPRRPLTAADVPSNEWKDRYGEYQLREDGVVLTDTNLEIGELTKDGHLAWYRA